MVSTKKRKIEIQKQSRDRNCVWEFIQVSAQSHSGQGKLGRHIAQLTTLIVSLKISIRTMRTGNNRGSRQELLGVLCPNCTQFNFEVNGGTTTMEKSDR